MNSYVLLLISPVLLSNPMDSSLVEFVKSKTDYCSIKCDGEDHTMCKFKEPSPRCIDLEESHFEVCANNMLHYHNQERSDIAGGTGISMNKSFPTATNMRLMVWDKELMAIAHRWLTQCVVARDKCRDTLTDKVGQNFAFFVQHSFSTQDTVKAFRAWGSEYENGVESEIESFTGSKNMHNFSQIFWANTYRLGCSEVIYNVGHSRVKVIACNYAPKGNTVGQPIYKRGRPCSECPTGTTCGVNGFYPYLCGKLEDLPDPKSKLTDEDSSFAVKFYPLPVLILTTQCLHKYFLLKTIMRNSWSSWVRGLRLIHII